MVFFFFTFIFLILNINNNFFKHHFSDFHLAIQKTIKEKNKTSCCLHLQLFAHFFSVASCQQIYLQLVCSYCLGATLQQLTVHILKSYGLFYLFLLIALVSIFCQKMFSMTRNKEILNKESEFVNSTIALEEGQREGMFNLVLAFVMVLIS